ncbi:MAG: hypothetical protein M3114_08995, partial [Thermoproteota archaeon]|nr:hypothetical protein [Thermoproteota archaeon]
LFECLYFTNSNERKISIGLAVRFYEKLFLDFQLHPTNPLTTGVLILQDREKWKIRKSRCAKVLEKLLLQQNHVGVGHPTMCF